MVDVKIMERRTTRSKKIITVKNVSIDQFGNFVDENGLIGKQIYDEIPDGITEFTFKITFELNDEDEENEEDKADENDYSDYNDSAYGYDDYSDLVADSNAINSTEPLSNET